MGALLVLGAGGHGKVVADAALDSGRWKRIAFLDDALGTNRTVIGVQVVGGLADLRLQSRAFTAAVVAIGDSLRRLELIDECRSWGLELPSIVHRSAYVSRFADLGAGCVVLAQAAVNAGASLGTGCIVNTGAGVDHDCCLADGVHVCPGAHLAGSVHVGRSSWIGVGASVRDRVKIGPLVTVGAGAVVVADVPEGTTVVGVPAKSRSGR